MAIYVTGDTHGSQSHGMYSIDGFMHRLNTTSFPEQKELGKEDYVIICGDFGGIWDVDRFYGHLHDNRRVFENNFLLYEQIIRIN